MTRKEWTREMYIQLEELVLKKTSPGGIAVKMGITKKDIPYRLQVLRNKKSILTWSDAELDLLEKSRSLEDYLRMYLSQFGKHHDKNVLIDHWMKRDLYLVEWQKEKEKRKQAHMIEIKRKQITEPIKEKARSDPVPDEGEMLANLNHRVMEMMLIFKDVIAIEKERLGIDRLRMEIQQEQLNVQREQLTIQNAMFIKATEKGVKQS